MIFKNARFFRFTKPVDFDPEQMENALKQDAFNPCGPQETSRQGWVPPLGKHGEQMVHVAGGCMLICLQKQEKILPGAVVNEIVDERCEAIETEQSRKVRRKERNEIKEEVTLELLPKAFHRNKRTFAFISQKDGYIVVDASSAKVAEDCASALRKSIGSLPVRPPAVNQSPAFTFTGWVSGSIERPETIELGQDCLLVDPSEDGGKLTAKGIDLESDELRNHIEAGMQVTRISVDWDESVKFSLDADLTLSRIRFGDAFQEKLDDVDPDDAAARFDAAFGLMTLELARLFPALLEALGGEDQSALVGKESSETPVTIQPRLNTEDTQPETARLGREPADALYEEAKSFVVEVRRASVSSIQRKFKIGYNRAAHLVDELEISGVISTAGHDGQRQVLG